MGMFDRLTSDYPLPSHQQAEYQTKGLAWLVHGESGIGGFLDEYRITADGRLMLRRHVREWRADADAPLGGCFQSVRDWWEEVPDVHGDVDVYAREPAAGDELPGRVEFRVRFTHGRVEWIKAHET